MKLAQQGDFDPKARMVEGVAACPQCHARAAVFADGAIVCIAEGGISFVPEPGDIELYDLKLAYEKQKAG
jgi:hypothetical protein